MLEDKARDLGRLIGQSDEYKAVMRANSALGEDAEAMRLVKEIEQLRKQAQEMLQRQEQPTQEMEQQLNDLLSEVQLNPAYQRMAVAQENLDKLMRRVNDLISDGIQKGAQSPIITLG